MLEAALVSLSLPLAAAQPGQLAQGQQRFAQLETALSRAAAALPVTHTGGYHDTSTRLVPGTRLSC